MPGEQLADEARALESYINSEPNQDEEESATEAAAEQVEDSDPASAVMPDFLGRGLDEEAARVEAERLSRLRSGETIREYGAEADAVTATWERLRAEHPGIETDEALEAMRPLIERVYDEHGLEAVGDPAILAQIYEEVGGSEVFGPPPAEVDEWRRAIPETKQVNAFTR